MSLTESPSLTLRKRFGSKLGVPHTARLSLDSLAHPSDETSSNSSCDNDRTSPSLMLSPSRSLRKLLPRSSGLGLREKKISDSDLLLEDVQAGMNSCDAARRLDKALQNRELRNQLVERLLSDHSEDVRKVRMLHAINEVLRTVDRKERSGKALMVVTLFIKEEAKFLVPGISPQLQADVVAMKFDGFVQLRSCTARELMANSGVQDVIMAFENNETKHQELEDNDGIEEAVKIVDSDDEDVLA